MPAYTHPHTQFHLSQDISALSCAQSCKYNISFHTVWHTFGPTTCTVFTHSSYTPPVPHGHGSTLRPCPIPDCITRNQETPSPVLTTPPFLSVTPSPPSQLAFTWTATLLSPPAPAGVRVSKVLPFTPYIDFCFHWTGSQPEPKNHKTALRGLSRPPVIRVLWPVGNVVQSRESRRHRKPKGLGASSPRSFLGVVVGAHSAQAPDLAILGLGCQGWAFQGQQVLDDMSACAPLRSGRPSVGWRSLQVRQLLESQQECVCVLTLGCCDRWGTDWMALDGCGSVLELVPTVRCSEKLKRVNTTIDLECLGLHWLEARLPGQRARASPGGESTESQPLG